MRRPIEDGLSLMLGAGLGVGLMYLLDPEKGSQRRQRLSQATTETLGSTGAMLGTALHAVTDTARAASHSVVEHAASWATRSRPRKPAPPASGCIDVASAWSTRPRAM